jgi:tripartite-type tricarboxylate transporter receptor subunit TctC
MLLSTQQRLRSCFLRLGKQRGLLALSLICSMGASFSSVAQTSQTSQSGSWPTRQVRIIVPYPAGGGIDILGRQIAERMAPLWGQAVLVENRPGGSTIPATELVARASDGHTLLLTTDSSMSINPHLFSKLPYDAVKDFLPVSQLVLLQQLMLAHPSLPANTLPELIALAKAKPGHINYGSYCSGSQPHLAAEMLKARAGIDLVHIPYKGIPQAVPAAIAGEVQLTFSGIASSLGQVRGGKLKAIAIGGNRRSPLMPEVPTFTELGYPEVETHAWFGLFLPAAAARELATRLQRDISRFMAEPEFRERQIVAKGYDAVLSTPEEFTLYLRRDSESRARAIRISGARAD